MSNLSPSQQPIVLFSIYQNNTCTMRRLGNETIDPATQHIILKIVGFKEFIMVNNNYMGLVFYHSLYFSDQEAQSESHQKTHECLYGMGSTGKKKNHGNVPRQTPC